jgi:hypothetical protein
MKVLRFTVSHRHLEELMCKGCIARLHKIVDLGHVRDHYEVTALVRQEHLDVIVAKSADRPRWVKWPES